MPLAKKIINFVIALMLYIFTHYLINYIVFTITGGTNQIHTMIGNIGALIAGIIAYYVALRVLFKDSLKEKSATFASNTTGATFGFQILLGFIIGFII